MEKTHHVNDLIAFFEKIILSQIQFRVEKYPIFDPMLETEVIPSISKIYDVDFGDVSAEKLAANALEEEVKLVEHQEAATTTNIEPTSDSEEANESQTPDESFFSVITKFKELEERASKCQVKSPVRPRYMKIRGRDATVHVDDDIRHKLEEILKKHLKSNRFSMVGGPAAQELCLESPDKYENQLNEQK